MKAINFPLQRLVKLDVMNVDIIRSALVEIRKTLVRAEDAMSQAECEAFGGGDCGGFVDAKGALGKFLAELNQMLLVLLDVAEMRDTRTELKSAWEQFRRRKNGLRRIVVDAEYDYAYSPALTYVKGLIRILSACTDSALLGTEAIEKQRLEWILENTAVLVHRRKHRLSREADLQHLMHDYLSAAFPDFVKHVRIPGGLKNFEPDCGVRSVNAAVEFKALPAI